MLMSVIKQDMGTLQNEINLLEQFTRQHRDVYESVFTLIWRKHVVARFDCGLLFTPREYSSNSCHLFGLLDLSPAPPILPSGVPAQGPRSPPRDCGR